jgi:hypothetical protein
LPPGAEASGSGLSIYHRLEGILIYKKIMVAEEDFVDGYNFNCIA